MTPVISRLPGGPLRTRTTAPRMNDADTALQNGHYGLAMMTARIAAARGEPEAERIEFARNQTPRRASPLYLLTSFGVGSEPGQRQEQLMGGLKILGLVLVVLGGPGRVYGPVSSP